MAAIENMSDDKNVSVIITNYSPLTENLIEWLKDIRLDFIMINGDHEKKDYSFLLNIKPAILLLDLGFIGQKEQKLMHIIKSSLQNTKVIYLTFDNPANYQNFMQKTGVEGLVVQWKDYRKLPRIMQSLLQEKARIQPGI